MTRIIAGEFAGRRLVVPKSGTRPTSDRVREAIFSALDARDALADAAVLDLYAGSGALGLEALSRGAASLTAVEASKPAAALIRANAKDLGVRVTVAPGKVATFLAGTPATFHLVLIDPPYDAPVDADLAALAAPRTDGNWLAGGAIVVVERSSRAPDPAFPRGFTVASPRRYGEIAVWLATWRSRGD